MAVPVVTINSNTYQVYATLADVEKYLAGTIGDGADAFRALGSGEDKSRLVVQATRYLDLLAWQGTATGLLGGDATELAWPRSGVVNPDGTTVDSTTVPAAVIKAMEELVAILAGDPDVVGSTDQGNNVKKLDADGTSIEFFRATSAQDGSAPVLPKVINQLIGKYLSSALAVSDSGSSGQSFGVDGCSQFDSCDTLSRSEPF
jgi:hypothetical protein